MNTQKPYKSLTDRLMPAVPKYAAQDLAAGTLFLIISTASCLCFTTSETSWHRFRHISAAIMTMN